MTMTLQLPHDYFRPGKLPAEATYAFALPATATDDADPRLLPAVALAISLLRAQDESVCALELRHGAGRTRLQLEATAETTAASLIASAVEMVRTARPGHPPSGMASAAVTWLDEQSGPPGLDGAPLHLATTASGRALLVYDSNRFREETAHRLAREIVTLLRAIPGQRHEPISRLPLLTDAETHAIEARCTGPSRDLGSAFAHQLFEAHAERAPQAIALRLRDRSMTYGELNAQANRLAHALIARGISAERRVMVCVEPSFEIAICLLAILKAGGVYVPLEPTYPQARIHALLGDTKPALVLTTKALANKLGLPETSLLLLDEPELLAQATTEVASSKNPAREIDDQQTAFIYYTSGTTGLPKGAMGSQANLRHYLRTAQERYGICASDAIPAVARFSFSISMFELMSPLIAGGTLILLERDHVLDPARLSRTLRELTLFHIGPSLLKSLLAYLEKHAGEGGPFNNIRHASSGGDMVSADLLEQLKRTFPLAEVFVIYGCSEVSCMGCTFFATRERALDKSYVGLPFDNTRVRILDKNLQLCPQGVIGEIAIAGDGVVKGYLDRPELTGEKFIEWGGHRYYRTGDVGRLSEEGFIEILGRRDFQVQLRGMRIELGEVEHHLRRAPGVREGVVVARESPQGDKALVAYFAGERDASGKSTAARRAVREYLREQLPDYMVPSIYVDLERLPLNHNLKIDRRALPAPAAEDQRLESAAPAAGFREPSTPTEKQLAAIWRASLGVEKIGLADHFFDLGGDSLRAIGLILRVDAELGVALEGLEIVRESLGTLARLCDQRRGVARETAPVTAPELAPIEPFHFGPEGSLYGVLHKPMAAASSTAVLVCAPLGAEATRTNFVLQRLARQLALGGVATLRFDYFGHGDSLGDSVSGDCLRWQQDIVCAEEELRRRTGATSVVAVGIRAGATLLAQVLERLEPARWVLWDPVCDGEAYVSELSQEQEDYLRNVRYRRRWQGISLPHGRIELAGATYSAIAARQLRGLKLAAAGSAIPLCWLESSRAPERLASFKALSTSAKSSRFEPLDSDPGWSDIARVEQTLPDVGISQRLLKLVLE